MDSENVYGLLAVFLVFIAPLWLILHYVSRWRMAKKGFDPNALKTIKELQDTSVYLSQRIETLENILDSKVPDWRRQR